ncbi:MAG: hypothetical protein CVU03_03050 [Bacteroidetes bacterium HGW-Bacteroidetes-2]|jgi:hypothetical protein|nr:MAG: hypothetical protein CVU03_03050 [Bacteroidetes bacterium HGW-Bacteroidetes-2]
MNSILRNILAIVAGLLIGNIVNMTIIMFSSYLVLPPPGVDTSTMEGLKEGMHLFEPKHYLMPFLAHALGTFTGAYVVALLAANNKMIFALVIGCFFFIGSILTIFILPSPTWFTILDLVVAYFPMAWLGGILAGAAFKKNQSLFRMGF